MRQRWPFGSKRGAIPQSVEYIMPTKWVGALCGYSAVTVFLSQGLSVAGGLILKYLSYVTYYFR